MAAELIAWLQATGAGPADDAASLLIGYLTEQAAALSGFDGAVRLGSIYESLLDWHIDWADGEPRLTRAPRRAGCHYTPLELAREVVAHTLDPLRDRPAGGWRILDPACGGGIFLLAAFERLGTTEGLFGIDRDPVAVHVTRLALALAGGNGARIVQADALLERPFEEPFDAVIGNPPFLGGSFISGELGREYRETLVRQVAGGLRGNADLCAYFVLRARELLRPGGRAGLICTHSIASGGTRRVGLEQLVQRATLVRAERRRRWPGAANVYVSLLWFVNGRVPGPAVLDGREVPAIDTRLAPGDAAEPPRRLAVHRGRAFNGTKIYGQGFLLAPDEAEAVLASDPRHAEVIRPYLSGDDVNLRPDCAASRLVIDFRDWPLERAEEYPELLALVRQRVRPEREKLAGRNTIGDQRASCWWQFGTRSAALERALAGRQTCLVRVIHSATHEFVEVPADQVFSHALAVVVAWDGPLLACLQSGLHEVWARAWGSALGEAPRYTLSRTLETFPLPARTDGLAEAIAGYLTCRTALQRRLGEGLTPLRRRLADPDDASVDELRQAVLGLDQVVARAYGWADLDLSRQFTTEGGRPAWCLRESADEEILARLRTMNETAAAEARWVQGVIPLDE